MADGGWVVLGTALGTAGSVLTTWLNAYLLQDKTNKVYDKKVILLLTTMLESGNNWHEFTELKRLIGAENKDVKEYLIMLGARGNEKNDTQWGLLKRNPLPAKSPKTMNGAQSNPTHVVSN